MSGESMYEMTLPLIFSCLIDAKAMLVEAGFNEKIVENHLEAVVQLALKLAEIKIAEETL